MKVSEKKMRLYWILVKIGLNFHFLASKWHLIAYKYPKYAVRDISKKCLKELKKRSQGNLEKKLKVLPTVDFAIVAARLPKKPGFRLE